MAGSALQKVLPEVGNPETNRALLGLINQAIIAFTGGTGPGCTLGRPLAGDLAGVRLSRPIRAAEESGLASHLLDLLAGAGWGRR